MTMTVKGFEKNNGVACVVVSIPIDELFNIPALSPILEQLTAPDASGALQDTSTAPVITPEVKKPRKPRTKKAAAEVAPAVTPVAPRPTYPNRKKATVVTPAPAAPAVAPTAPANNANSNAAKMQNHCPHCSTEQFATYKQWLAAGYKVIPGQHGAKLMGISEAIVNGIKTNKPFFFIKFCACQVEAVVAKQVG